MKKKEYQHRFDHIGPGGMKCSCCGPAPGQDKKKTLRAAKRRMKQTVHQEICEAIEDDEAVKEAVDKGEGLIGPEWPEENDDYQEYLDFMSQVVDGTQIDLDDEGRLDYPPGPQEKTPEPDNLPIKEDLLG